MSTALLAVAAVFGLLAALLAVPVEVAFRCRGIDAFEAELATRWLFGLVRVRARMPDPQRRQGGKWRTPARRRRPRPAGRRRPGNRGGVLAVLRQTAFRRRVWRLLGDLARASNPRQLGLRLRLGLGDPADTGRLWAVVGPLAAAAQRVRHAEVRIEPEFAQAALEFEAYGRLRLVPLRWLALALGFALAPASIRAWRTLAGSHA